MVNIIGGSLLHTKEKTTHLVVQPLSVWELQEVFGKGLEAKLTAHQSSTHCSITVIMKTDSSLLSERLHVGLKISVLHVQLGISAKVHVKVPIL